MRCDKCSSRRSKVIDSRPLHDDRLVRRRRQCLGCRQRFTTYEVQSTDMSNAIGLVQTKVELRESLQATQKFLDLIVQHKNRLKAQISSKNGETHDVTLRD